MGDCGARFQKQFPISHVTLLCTCTCMIDAWVFEGTATAYIFHVHSEDLEVAQ